MNETGDTPKVVIQLAVGWSPKGLNRVSLVMDSKNLPSTAREMLESEDSMNLPSTARETLESDGFHESPFNSRGDVGKHNCAL